MGVGNSKENSDTINWNNIKTENVSSSAEYGRSGIEGY